MPEEDPKAAARAEVSRPETQQLLRQFLNHDGPKGSNAAYKAGWERIFGKKDPEQEEECETEEGG
jgi:hypothetical protein